MTFERTVGVVQWVVGVAAATFAVMLFSMGPKEGGFDLTESPYAAPRGGGEPDVDLVIDQGAEIYRARCATCHGSTGEGGVGPQLAGRMVDTYPDAAVQVALVSSGRNSMPGFSSRLTPDELEAVVAFTRESL